jgi:hypothetical protein
VAQVVEAQGPEFKLQYCQKKKDNWLQHGNFRAEKTCVCEMDGRLVRVCLGWWGKRNVHCASSRQPCKCCQKFPSGTAVLLLGLLKASLKGIGTWPEHDSTNSLSVLPGTGSSGRHPEGPAPVTTPCFHVTRCTAAQKRFEPIGSYKGGKILVCLFVCLFSFFPDNSKRQERQGLSLQNKDFCLYRS